MNTFNQLVIKRFSILFILGIIHFQVFGQTSQTFNSTTTWTAPNCVTRVNVEVWGAGGGGAGNGTASNGGGGGTGGGYSAANAVPVVPGTTYTVTVGVGGVGGLMAADATANGGTGGDSWFINNTTVLAIGGGGGSRPSGGLGGAGGAIGISGIGGFATFNGGQGGNGGNGGAAVGGGGGSSAGTAFAGANGAIGGFGGAGGTAPAGGGDGGDGTAANGSPGIAPGGGGGGGGINSTGGAGANGKVFLDWTAGLEAQPNMTSANSRTVCTGVALGLTLTDDVAGVSTFKWIANDNPNTTGESLTLDSAAVINDIIINPTAVAQVVTYTVTPTSQGGCEGIPQVVNATINPGGVITLTSAAGTDAQAVCENTPITNITYTVTGGATGASASLLPAGIIGNYAAGVFTISGSTAITGLVNYVITTTGAACGNDTIAGTIDVKSATSLNLTSLNNNQTVCEGGTIANIVYATDDSATVSGLPAGLNGVYSDPGNSFTISGAPTSAGVYNYTVTTSGACPAQNATGTITVDSNAVLSLVSPPATASQTVCEGTPITPIVYAVAGSGYLVTANFSSLPLGILVTNNATNDTVTISGTTSVVGVHSYTIVSTGGNCFQDTITGSFRVDGAPTIVFNSGNTNQVVCEGSPIANINYGISDSVTVAGLPNGVTDSQGGGVVTLSGTPTVPGVYNYTVTTTGNCPSVNETGTIQVDSNSVLTLVSATATANQSVCEGDPIVDIVYSATGNPFSGATATFSSLPAGITVISSGNSVTISGSTNVAGTHTFTVTSTGGFCLQDTLIGSITVTPTTGPIALVSGNPNPFVCVNEPIPFDIVFSVGDSATVAPALPTGVTGVYSRPDGTFTIGGTPTVAGTFTYTVSTVSPCAAQTATGTITVDSNAVVTLTSAPATANQTVCANDSIDDIIYTFSGSAMGLAVIPSPLPLGLNIIPGPGSNSITITGSTAFSGSTSFTVTTTGGLCLQDTLTGSITVEPQETIVLNTLNNVQAACEGTPIVDIVYTVSDSATVTGLPAGVTGIDSAGILTISGSPTAIGVFAYTVTTAGTCPATPATGTITVNPVTPISLFSAAGTDAQSVCEGDAIQEVIFTTAPGSTMGISFLPLGLNTISVLDTLTISGATLVAGTHNYTVTSSGTCPGTRTGYITVNPVTAITYAPGSGPDNQFICENQNLIPIIYTVGDSATVTSLPNGVTTSIASGELTIGGAPTVAGIYDYTVTTVNSCPPVSTTGSFTVNPNAILTLTSAAGTDSQVVCEGDSIVPITYTFSGGATGITVAPLFPLGIGATINGNVLTISGATNISGTTNYTVAATGVCTQDSLYGSISISPSTFIAQTSLPLTNAQVICETDSIQHITYSTGDSAVVTGLPTGVTYSINNGETRIKGTPTTPGSYTYTVSTTGPCPSASTTGTITVNPNGILNLTSAVGTDSQTICINDPIIDVVYTASGGATSVAISGILPLGLSTLLNANGDVLTISGTPAVTGNFTYTVVSTGGGCYQETLLGYIDVYNGVGITLTSQASTENQTVCENDSIVDITYSITGAGTGATVSGLPNGVSGAYASGIFTISGTPTVTGTFNYSVTTVSNCTNVTDTGSITVNPEAAIDLTSGIGSDSVNACVNTAIAPITYAISGGGDSATVSTLPAGITGSFSGGIFTISGTPTTTGTTNYTVTPTGTCLGATATGVIIVDEDATITITSIGADTQTVCENTPITAITYTVSGGADSASVSALPAGLTGSFAAGVFTISGTPTSAGVTNYTVTTSGKCAQATAEGLITVNPDAIITLTSAVGTDSQNVCTNIAITDITYAVSGGADSASVSALPVGVTASFAGGVLTITGTPTIAGTTNYTVTTTGTCTQTTATGTIDVNTATGLTLSSAVGTDSQTVCANDTLIDITYAVTGGGTGATVTALPAGLTSTYNAGVFTISGIPTVAGTTNYTVTTTGTCVQQSLSGTIIVDQDAIITLTSIGTDTQTVCENVPITDIVYSISGAGTGATVSGLPTGVTGLFGAGVFTISGTPTAIGTFDYTVTPSGSCVTQKALGTITVTPDVSLTLTSVGADSQNVCVDVPITSITYSVTGAADSVKVFGLPAGFTDTLASGIYTINGSAAAAGPISYTVTAYGSCSSVSKTGLITIDPDATITLSSVVGTDSQTVCENVAITDIVYTLSGGATDAGTLLLPPGVTGTTSGNSYTISGTPTATGIYNYIVNTLGSCKQAQANGSIQILGDAALALTTPAGSDAQAVCEKTPIDSIRYTTTGDVDSVLVSGLPAGTSSSFNFGIVSIVGSPSVVGTFSYTVTTYGACVQTDTIGQITVNPDAEINLTSGAGTDSQDACLNAPIDKNITYAISGGGTGASVTALPAGMIGAYAGGVFTISGTPTATGTTSYTVTTTGTCEQKTATGTINVVETTLSLSSAVETTDQTHCSFNTITDIVYAVGGTATGANINPALPSALTSNFVGGVFTISGTLDNLPEGNYTYTVTTTGGKCASKSETFSFTIANPVADFVTEPSIGKPGLMVYFNNFSANATTYNWDFDNGFTSTEMDTINTYPEMGDYRSMLIASNNSKCPDTAYAPITIYKVIVPNIFSPNGDLVNDVFSFDTDGIVSVEVEIYNRWGLKMYEWFDVSGSWDGKNLKNVDCPDGTYYYILKTVDIFGEKYDQNGFITIIR